MRGLIVTAVVPSLLVLTGGCHHVFGVEPPDAVSPPSGGRCPPLGETPRFQSVTFEAIPRACYDYSASTTTGRALASCTRDSRLTIEEGPLEGPLEEAMLAPSFTGANLDRPGLSPEGEHLVVRQFTPGLNHFSWYVRDANAWRFETDLVDTLDFQTSVGVPSRGPDRRIMAADQLGVRELAQQGITWSVVHSYTWSQLGVAFGYQLNLSPDGLRLNFLASQQVMYADRASLDVPFGMAREIESVSSMNGVFLLENCERIYFSGLGGIQFRNLAE